MSLTNKQWAIVEWIRKDLIPAVVGETHASKHEIKDFDVSIKDHGIALVWIDFGRIGDEGTMASIFCREHFSFMVAKSGACRRLDSYKMYRGHPARTHFKARTAKEASAIKKLRREAKKGQTT